MTPISQILIEVVNLISEPLARISIETTYCSEFLNYTCLSHISFFTLFQGEFFYTRKKHT